MPPTLIVGLGNPGPRYKGTRHNAGFAVVDALAALHQVRFRTWERLRVASLRDSQMHLLLAKPMTFMNLSGDGIQPLVVDRRIPPDRILVVHDDLDLEAGKLRFRRAGGAGGHRGVQSLIERLGASGFPRLKIGIGRPPDGTDPVEYVLQRPDGAGSAPLVRGIERAGEACLVWAREGLERAMSLYNTGVDEPGGDREGNP
ncbi:MAG: aminoacyl-tRNA hydrolase [Bacillota bacterium]|nr:aminoacyl-tRNA hydrolase [Bacillota bacterium]